MRGRLSLEWQSAWVVHSKRPKTAKNASCSISVCACVWPRCVSACFSLRLPSQLRRSLSRPGDRAGRSAGAADILWWCVGVLCICQRAPPVSCCHLARRLFWPGGLPGCSLGRACAHIVHVCMHVCVRSCGRACACVCFFDCVCIVRCVVPVQVTRGKPARTVRALLPPQCLFHVFMLSIIISSSSISSGSSSCCCCCCSFI